MFSNKSLFILKSFIKNSFFSASLIHLNQDYTRDSQKGPEYLEWVGSNLVEIASRFINQNKLEESGFVKILEKSFKTKRFRLLIKRWTVEYLVNLYNLIYQYCSNTDPYKNNLMLEDNLLNRFAVNEFLLRFNVSLKIQWIKEKNILKRFISIFILSFFIIYISVKKGVRFSAKRRKFKVLREALWGLYDIGGYFFHDDFLVDGKRINKNDLLLFSREISGSDYRRLKGSIDAKGSDYTYFFLKDLKISLMALIGRVLIKYIYYGSLALLGALNSRYFSFFWNIFYFHVNAAIPYEKIFANFEIESELGHNYFQASHICESIVCQSHETKYFLTHWSDNSVSVNKYILSFLGCDKLLLWGKSHIQGVEGDDAIYELNGYFFKNFIQWVAKNKEKVLTDMHIKSNGKIIVFFDETFGKSCKMTEEHYVNFWDVALNCAKRNNGHTVVIKPKINESYNELSDEFKIKFMDIKNKMRNLKNVYILDAKKWSFIEATGISDLVVTQGMTSSATIAIICGINGLYFDQANHDHLFSRNYKDRAVFDNAEKILDTISKILNGEINIFNIIPGSVIRSFDSFDDDLGIERLRSALVT